jgi:hypothetical protein
VDSGLLVDGGAPGSPAARARLSIAWDNAGRDLYVYSGHPAGSPVQIGDLWRFDHDGWTRISSPEDQRAPPARRDASMVWDSSAKQLVLFGGAIVQGGPPTEFRSDLWAYGK